ncbi:uncharacterized protein PFL1_04033 [Pseudozyma flocculosa PF-1]|uniref:Glutathione S-transferase n=2 Tax=Pseudozyma flocculosa TaxID=84751 RepID=A0A5C3EW50_9BASI|nr:uncharacterized protein PFL1_04033 [Pseudozyma flocculosa PF-1]EPQ28205.1 hypothetical protein PFL1_04033 [Pseudozyma flocculosa PF-1]SPO35341.1 uncharacterized protein PSFLO_00812 [Pseudozyma flocculosa]
MSQSHDLLLYTAKVCPYAHRTELALEESGAKYDTFQVDLANKPEWYAEKVNKASKVPTLVVDDKKPDQFNLPESMVIVEFVSDLFDPVSTGNTIHSKDPKVRADSRYIVERFAQLVVGSYMSAALKQDVVAFNELVQGLRTFNELILERSSQGPFIKGDKFTFADIGIAPIFGRILTVSKTNLFPSSADAAPIHELLEKDASLARVKTWWEAVSARPSWQKTYDEKLIVDMFTKRIQGAQQQAK